jgi:hypothetical protein
LLGAMPEKIYRRNEEIVTRKIAGELFLVPIRGNLADMQRIFVLNPVAEFVWQKIDEQKTLDEICKGVVARFDVEEERGNSDVREFIDELLEAGLIKG